MQSGLGSSIFPLVFVSSPLLILLQWQALRFYVHPNEQGDHLFPINSRPGPDQEVEKKKKKRDPSENE